MDRREFMKLVRITALVTLCPLTFSKQDLIIPIKPGPSDNWLEAGTIFLHEHERELFRIPKSAIVTINDHGMKAIKILTGCYSCKKSNLSSPPSSYRSDFITFDDLEKENSVCKASIEKFHIEMQLITNKEV